MKGAIFAKYAVKTSPGPAKDLDSKENFRNVLILFGDNASLPEVTSLSA